MRTIIPKNARLIPDGAKKVFKGEIFDVYQWPQRVFDGTLATFEMLKRPDTVKVIAVKDGKIVTIIEDQPHRGMKHSTPGGRHDIEQETELDCAKRETAEETGLTFKNWRLLSAYQPQNKIEWFVYTFLATEVTGQSKMHPDAGEKISVKLMDFDDVKSLALESADQYLPAYILQKCNSLPDLLAFPGYD